MKTLVAIVITILSVSAHAVVLEQAQKLAGSYVAQGNCSYETASVKNEKSANMDFFVVRLANKTTNTFSSRAINMDNMFTKVRTTRGMQRIVIRDVLRDGIMVAQEKTCLPGWVGCSEFKTAMSAEIIDENTMEVVMGNETCTFSKPQ